MLKQNWAKVFQNEVRNLGKELGISGLTVLKMREKVQIKVRNESEFLERCLDSVFSSNLDSKNFEVIIVDSESEDGSLKIIKKYPVKLLKFDKKKFISEKIVFKGDIGRIRDIKIHETGDLYLLTDKGALWRMYK